jgi:hypothetical protein
MKLLLDIIKKTLKMFIYTLLNLLNKQKFLSRIFYFFAILLLEYNNKTNTLVSIKLLCKYKRSFQTQ